MKSKTDAGRKYRLTWRRREFETRLEPVAIGMGVLKEYVGKYGKRRISLQCGQLKLHFGNGSDVRLLPMGNDLFTLDTEDNFSRNRVQFERNKTTRKVTGFHFLDDDGDVFPTDKRSADR